MDISKVKSLWLDTGDPLLEGTDTARPVTNLGFRECVLFRKPAAEDHFYTERCLYFRAGGPLVA